MISRHSIFFFIIIIGICFKKETLLHRTLIEYDIFLCLMILICKTEEKKRKRDLYKILVKSYCLRRNIIIIIVYVKLDRRKEYNNNVYVIAKQSNTRNLIYANRNIN